MRTNQTVLLSIGNIAKGRFAGTISAEEERNADKMALLL